MNEVILSNYDCRKMLIVLLFKQLFDYNIYYEVFIFRIFIFIVYYKKLKHCLLLLLKDRRNSRAIPAISFPDT